MLNVMPPILSGVRVIVQRSNLPEKTTSSSGDAEGEALGVGFGEALGLGLTLGEGVGLVSALGEGDGLTLGKGETLGEGVTCGVGDGTMLGSGVGEGEGSSEGIGLGDGEGVASGEALGLGSALGDGDASGPSSADALFCGFVIVCKTKSFPLLSVSSPFPAVSSVPPLVNDSGVEMLVALRSMLWFVAGTAALVDSTKLAVPIPTKSTIVSPASLYSVTVLFAATALEVEEYAISALTDPS